MTLSLLIPIAYPSGAPINDPPRIHLANRIRGESIPTFLQGVELHRPTWVLGKGLVRYDEKNPNIPGDYGVVTIAEELPSGIHVEGYIYWQRTQLFYQDLTGLQIRASNVGIGRYDPGWLKYPGKQMSGREGLVSGEIYVTYSNDLLDALKTDREGFDEDSGVYKDLQACIHKHLRRVLSTITKVSALRSKAKSESSPPKKNPNNASQTSVADVSEKVPFTRVPSISRGTA